MSQDISLMVRFADLAIIETAIAAAQRQLVDRVDELRRQICVDLAGWDQTTESRAAQIEFESRLTADFADLTAALAKIGAAVARVSDAAHAAEVRNVAIMD